MFINKDKEVIPLGSYEWEGVKHPPSIFRLWSDEDLSSVGVFRVEFIDIDIPEGKQAVGYEYNILEHHATASPILEDIQEIVPQEVTRAQGKGALLLANLLDEAEQYIETLEGKEKMLALIAFNETNNWQRDSEFLKGASQALGLTEGDLDDLFITAEKIKL